MHALDSSDKPWRDGWVISMAGSIREPGPGSRCSHAGGIWFKWEARVQALILAIIFPSRITHVSPTVGMAPDLMSVVAAGQEPISVTVAHPIFQRCCDSVFPPGAKRASSPGSWPRLPGSFGRQRTAGVTSSVLFSQMPTSSPAPWHRLGVPQSTAVLHHLPARRAGVKGSVPPAAPVTSDTTCKSRVPSLPPHLPADNKIRLRLKSHNSGARHT